MAGSGEISPEAELDLRRREVAVKEMEAELKRSEHDLRLLELANERIEKDRDYELRKDEQRLRRAEHDRAKLTNPLVIAVFAAALAAGGNAFVAYINGSAQRELEKTRSDAQLNLERYKSDAQNALEKEKALALQQLEEGKAETARILEVIRTGDPEKAAENLDFLLKAGLITNKERRAALEGFLKDRKPGEGPSTPSPGGAQRAVARPSYDVPPPDPVAEQSETANRLLKLAVTELNRNVDETSSFDVIEKYWSALGIRSSDSRDVMALWSGAFLSWLIKESGNPDKVRLSPSILQIWNDSRSKKLTFLPGEKPVLPGDIVIFMWRATAGGTIDDARQGKLTLAASHGGIVLKVDGKVLHSIEGNNRNALLLSPRNSDDGRIVGYIRLR